MQMTGNNEDTIRTQPANYLDIVEFIQNYGCKVKMNICINSSEESFFNTVDSKTDDYPRNHGFVLNEEGWM
jgi:hypothetical protein